MNCPHCNSRVAPKGELAFYHPSYVQRWKCGTMQDKDGAVCQSESCRIAELEAENEKLRATIFPFAHIGREVVCDNYTTSESWRRFDLKIEWLLNAAEVVRDK